MANLLEGKYLIDVFIANCSRPQKDISLGTMLTKVTDNFIECGCSLVHNKCLITYQPTDDKKYQNSKDWINPPKKLISEVYNDVKLQLKKR